MLSINVIDLPYSLSTAFVQKTNISFESSSGKHVLSVIILLLLNAMTFMLPGLHRGFFFHIIPYVFAFPWLPKLRYVVSICGSYSCPIIRATLEI